MKKFSSLLPDSIKLPLFKRHLARSIASEARAVLTILDQPDGISPLQVSLRKDSSGIRLALDVKAAMGQPFVYRMLYARLPVVLRIFSQTAAAVRTVTADLSDGGAAPAGGLAFCSGRDHVILVPDPVFYNSGGYAEFRRPSLNQPWPRRNDTVLWRGTLTGIGAVTTETMAADDPHLRQRARMCLILRGVPGTDAKIHKSESGGSPVDRERLASQNLLGGKIKQANWGRYKFALDVDGHTNAWSNFFVRMLLGCCILKVASEHGFRQWYYDRLKPWQHYVPVRADMSDLIEKIGWCRSHDDECANIASAGRAVALAMTVESEIDEAVSRLALAKTSDVALAANAP